MAEFAVTESKHFGIADYVVFALTLVISAAIGIYFACTGGKQKTTKEFLHADGKMSIIPVAVSLTVSFLSANSIIGMPSENYYYGIMFAWILLGFCLAMIVSAYLFLPVFYELQLTSVYEYVELRFNRPLRVIICAVGLFGMTLYMALALYAPCLALAAVTGIKTWISVIILGVVTTAYTTVGGMKAVLWTDTFQALIMFCGMLAVIIKGSIDQGASTIWENAVEGGRINIFNWSEAFDFNPLTRHTAWCLVIGGAALWTTIFGTNQAVIQRAMCVSSLRRAQISFWLNIPGLAFVVTMGSAAGVMIYSQFKDCDPLISGSIDRPDQLYPLYIMEVLGNYGGLPGLVVAAVFSGAISTVSSGLSSLAAITLCDIVKLVIKPDITDEKATLVSKFVCIGFGILSICLTFVFSTTHLILQAGFTVGGVIGGPSMGVFIGGMFFPCINTIGCMVGFFISLAFTAWIGFGGLFYKKYTPRLPLSVKGCLMTGNMTSTNMLNMTTTTTQSIEALIAESRSGVGILYNISYQWIICIGIIIFMIISLLVSAMTGNNSKSSIDDRLLSPVVRKLRKRISGKLNRACCSAVKDKQETMKETHEMT